jgi:hypothetical protein
MSRRVTSVFRPLVMLGLLVVSPALPTPVSAQDIVTITEVIFERFGGLSAGTPSVALSITCDGTGIIGDLSVVIEQGDLRGTTNLDLLDAPCTTVPTRYIIHFDVFDDHFHPGQARIISALTRPDPGVEFGTGQRIILRNGSLPGT